MSATGQQVDDAGDGVDTLDFTHSGNNVSIDLSQSLVTSESGTIEQVLNIENVIAGSGDNDITGSNVDNVLAGGAGDDTLSGGAGNDTYIYAQGNGNDVINDAGIGGGTDRLHLTDLNAGDVGFSRSAQNALVVTVLLTLETITITEYFEESSEGIESILFADGTILDAAGIQAKFEAENPVTDAPPPTDDLFEGTGASDTFTFEAGHGNDSISSSTNNSGEVDRIIFGDGITVDDIFAEYVGTDLRISHETEDGSLTVINDADDSRYAEIHQIEAYEFSDGTTLNRQEFLAQVLGTDGDDVFNASGENDTFSFRGGEGDDRIDSYSNNYEETDRIKFGDGITANDIYAEYVGADLKISHKTLGGSITIVKDADDSRYAEIHQIEAYEFSDGTTLNRQEFLAQVLGTDGDDVFNGSGESDTFSFQSNQGDDQIVSVSDNSGEVDTIVFKDGIGVDDLTSQRLDVNADGVDDLVISQIGQDGSLTVISAYSGDNYANLYAVDQFVFEDGTVLNQADFITATDELLA
ncbi:calcium-binding protein [Roseovarius sp. EL26]|uniref:calcium-binding protein n=1 Tax=Roseovarius sp. EL26 TaxID=2126672 RepID=UPI000EA10478|nr:calcium-binding protein [Roseovarius sp. EL26]